MHTTEVGQARGGARLFEMDVSKRTGGTSVSEDLNIHIPPELILQLMPIFSKKYKGVNFTKFKCRMALIYHIGPSTCCLDPLEQSHL